MRERRMPRNHSWKPGGACGRWGSKPEMSFASMALPIASATVWVTIKRWKGRSTVSQGKASASATDLPTAQSW
jgi:hypothetical protein